MINPSQFGKVNLGLFIALHALVLVVLLQGELQCQSKVRVVGFLPVSNDPVLVEAFRQRLRELGYDEGKNLRIEYRYPLGRLDQVPALVEQLLQLGVDVLVVGPQPGIHAAKKLTQSIPIVMISSVDPVTAGFVVSLSHPGGNITGVSKRERELSAKRLELLKEILPRMSRLVFSGIHKGPDPKSLSTSIRQRHASLPLIYNHCP